ncbi:hypothetical protein [Solidesulfovibrio sp.]|uniref:hypothetical protein n=1 Tax=Solidesulfovibrio sp. TaxID=2910990 RepID=UPI002B1F9C35|nr:hypothetical protein [Solidesulfovibrio sp.]MEA4854876.1 hypothetical protein [Solidesulfovibrio sp.]
MSQAPRPRRKRTARSAAWAAAWLVLVFGLGACQGDNLRANLVVLQQKQQLIDAVRAGLLTAVDQEKNALLSPSQTEAKLFLDKGREAMAGVRKDMGSLAQLVDDTGYPKEIASYKAVAADFEEMAAIDGTLRGLAGRNTNLRAAELSRTEAALAANRLQQALTPVIDAADCQASQDALRVVTATLSVLSLHAQHIDEKTGPGMDTLEAAMNRQHARAQAALDRLAGLSSPTIAAALAPAQAAYADFWRVTREVLALSRENTNIEAQALAMGKKRLMTAKTLADLAALQEVVAEKEFTATR